MPRKRAKTKAKLSAADLRNWKLFAEFQRRLQPVLEKAPVSATELDTRRRLLSADYFSLILFGLLNPVLKTMRGLVEASALPRMKIEVCRHQVSLGSFSEMQHLVDPELLAGLLRSLAGEAGPRFGDAKVREQVGELIANDGTLLPALPRMAWALWQDSNNRAAKLHLEL
ncbi:MAG: IS4/IS5 family transposase, partial [Verrucomicrobia bacterium]|nr:IS4/IS5 family transposase [Verrucomicrobiota bacterium]